MARPQPGIFAQGTRSHYHLEFDLRAGRVRRRRSSRRCTACASRRSPRAGRTSWSASVPTCGGASSPTTPPPSCAPFEAIEGDGRRAPATQHDIWVWTHGTGEDVELDVARAVAAVLAPVATLAAEQPCFVYRDSRDLTGFIDGTENPPVEEAFDVALVPDGEPGAGGAFVLAQKWVHDLAAFHAQSQADQEGTIGRTKPDSVELDDKPPTAHIARVVIEEDGEELELYRRSTPYGRVGEARALLPRLQRRPVALHQDAAPHVRAQRRRPARPPHRLHPAGERRVLLRAVARRPRRHPPVRLTAGAGPL